MRENLESSFSHLSFSFCRRILLSPFRYSEFRTYSPFLSRGRSKHCRPLLCFCDALPICGLELAFPRSRKGVQMNAPFFQEFIVFIKRKSRRCQPGMRSSSQFPSVATSAFARRSTKEKTSRWGVGSPSFFLDRLS